MDITLPSDCGNSPRMALVADLAIAWASGNQDTLEQSLVDAPSWHHFGPDLPAVAPTHAVVLGAINHGRSASCDGYLDFAEGVQPQRARFSHVFTFTSMVKTAKVKEIRTYLVEES
ncbi:hypothetical protein [Corynebacterium ammoniagenes]|nr:hypothetical protein [Corynebacterium ammoniagenes]AQS74502.1 hypothetical protein CA40472_11860 [Corynebacterium ammoniagenes]NMF32105.1 hypothetical protein [Corynebacterium ammoniagenes]